MATSTRKDLNHKHRLASESDSFFLSPMRRRRTAGSKLHRLDSPSVGGSPNPSEGPRHRFRFLQKPHLWSDPVLGEGLRLTLVEIHQLHLAPSQV